MPEEPLEARVEARRRALRRALEHTRERAEHLQARELEHLDALNGRIETLQRQLSRTRYLLRHGWRALDPDARAELSRWLRETREPRHASV
jgi:hypothetical protein